VNIRKKQCFDDPSCFPLEVASGLQSEVEVTEALIHSALKRVQKEKIYNKHIRKFGSSFHRVSKAVLHYYPNPSEHGIFIFGLVVAF